MTQVKGKIEEILDRSELLAERALQAQHILRLRGNPYIAKYVTRFINRVEISDGGCWLWNSTLNSRGYARMGMYSRLILMHRWSYILFKGDIPQGLVLDHLCRTPNCVNPDHLEVVTQLENILRSDCPSSLHARATHCPQGHPYDEQNTRVSKRGGRDCRACKREKMRPYHEILTAQRTHCPQGHPYDEENTGINKNGRRYCKICCKINTPNYKRNHTQQGKRQAS